MTTIKNLLNRVQSLDLRTQVPVIIENTEDEIVSLNQEQLYMSGIDKDGEKLDYYRNPDYSKMKAAMNPNPGAGTPDLNLTGSFYRGFKVDVDKNVFTIDSTDSKTKELEEKYGNKIFGLTDANKTRYSKGLFWDAVKLYIISISGLKFK